MKFEDRIHSHCPVFTHSAVVFYRIEGGTDFAYTIRRATVLAVMGICREIIRATFLLLCFFKHDFEYMKEYEIQNSIEKTNYIIFMDTNRQCEYFKRMCEIKEG